jgi:hypothetical protein
MANSTQITPPRVPIIDQQTGYVSREWYRFFYSLYTFAGTGTGILPISSGGTGTSDIPANGELLIGNGTGYDVSPLTAGSGIGVTNAAGSITLDNTGVLSNIAGAGIAVSSATGDVTIDNTGVLSFSGGSTGLTPAAATTGAVTLAGTLAIANGGTNGSAAPTLGGSAYGTGSAYAFTAAGTSGQVLKSNGAAAPTWASLSSLGTLIYGSFYSTENQPDGSTTTAYPLTYNNTAYSNYVSYQARTATFTASITTTNMTVTANGGGTIWPGMIISGTGVTAGTRIISQTSGTTGGIGVYVVSVSQTVASTTISGTVNSKLVAALAGLYNIQFSVQMVNTAVAIHDMDIWFRKNGVDIAESNSQFSVPNSHGGVDGHALGALNLFIDLAAGDYIEIMWATASTNTTIQYIGPQTSPTRPGTPSVIVTMALAAPPQL